MQGYVGGFGTAVMRLIFIRYPSKLGLGQNTTALLISIWGLTTSAGLVFLVAISPRRSQTLASACMAESKDLRRVIFDYSSDKSEIYEARMATLFVIVVVISMVLSEVWCYALIYKFMADHCKSMINVLPETSIKKRIRKNVIDLTGHTMNFVVEALWVLYWLLRVLNKKSNMGETKLELLLTRCFVMSMDGTLSILHVGFSSELRADFIGICHYFWDKLRPMVSATMDLMRRYRPH